MTLQTFTSSYNSFWISQIHTIYIILNPQQDETDYNVNVAYSYIILVW